MSSQQQLIIADKASEHKRRLDAVQEKRLQALDDILQVSHPSWLTQDWQSALGVVLMDTGQPHWLKEHICRLYGLRSLLALASMSDSLHESKPCSKNILLWSVMVVSACYHFSICKCIKAIKQRCPADCATGGAINPAMLQVQPTE